MVSSLDFGFQESPNSVRLLWVGLLRVLWEVSRLATIFVCREF